MEIYFRKIALSIYQFTKYYVSVIRDCISQIVLKQFLSKVLKNKSNSKFENVFLHTEDRVYQRFM